MRRGQVTVNAGRQTFGPFDVVHGTYKHLLFQWEHRDLVTVSGSDGAEHNYKSKNVTAINWTPDPGE